MNCSDNGGKLAILHSLFLSLFPDIITTKWDSHEYLILGAKYNLLNEKLNTEHNCHICEQGLSNIEHLTNIAYRGQGKMLPASFGSLPVMRNLAGLGNCFLFFLCKLLAF